MLAVNELRHRFPVAGLLKIARLPRSTYYYRRTVASQGDKHAALRRTILKTYHRHKGRYGYRRITADIRRRGSQVNHKTVQRLMMQMNLKSLVRAKKYRSYRGEGSLIAPDLLKRKFGADRPNRKWATDVTEFRVGDKKLYLSPILDLYNGEIVAYQVAKRPLFKMVDSMLSKAFVRLSAEDCPILHSDQGWQYKMPAYLRRLSERGVRPSMSRKGNCLDNAAIESFFATLKSELYYLNVFSSRSQLAAAIGRYIRYYNQDRIKLKLDGMSPIEYRLRHAA